MDEIERLKELLAKATPLPWEYDCGVSPPDGPERYADIYWTDEDREPVIIAAYNEFRESNPEWGIVNPKLIVAAVNSLPSLLGEFATLTAERDAAVKRAEDAEAFSEYLRSMMTTGTWHIIESEQAFKTRATAAEAEVKRLRDAAVAVRDDLLERALWKPGADPDDLAVDVGAGVWNRLNAALGPQS